MQTARSASDLSAIWLLGWVAGAYGSVPIVERYSARCAPVAPGPCAPPGDTVLIRAKLAADWCGSMLGWIVISRVVGIGRIALVRVVVTGPKLMVAIWVEWRRLNMIWVEVVPPAEQRRAHCLQLRLCLYCSTLHRGIPICRAIWWVLRSVMGSRETVQHLIVATVTAPR